MFARVKFALFYAGVNVKSVEEDNKTAMLFPHFLRTLLFQACFSK